MGKKDWDCDKDGHVPVSKKVRNAALAGRQVTFVWCGMCGKKLKGLHRGRR
jgi:hypothetical protein